MKLADIQEITTKNHEGKEHSLLLITPLQPIVAKPLDLGADIVMHSATPNI
jgi:cystathionine beta-lyase/cystathionine gamma-synthase